MLPVQMGVSRAGWYSYDLLDNLGRPSAEVILPQYQSIQIGDVVPMSPDGKQGMRLLGFEQDRWLLWWDNKGDSTWVWTIHAAEDGTSRLVSRVRAEGRNCTRVVIAPSRGTESRFSLC